MCRSLTYLDQGGLGQRMGSSAEAVLEAVTSFHFAKLAWQAMVRKL
jgi:hypothetical protein